MCQHRRQEQKCKCRGKKIEKDAAGQTDNDFSMIQAGDIISYWSMTKESIILSVSEMDYINSEIGQNKDLWSHPQLE